MYLQAGVEQGVQVIALVLPQVEGEVALGGCGHRSLHETQQGYKAGHYMVGAEVFDA
ncbi:hypothetical protein D3C75_1352170 [compost metagenome]